MTFLGLSLAALGATFAAAGAATVALYILKLRRRPVAVPFSPIWQRVLRDKDASQLFSRLRNLLSLLLQLVLLGLIVLALGDPRPAAGAAEGHSIVVLVDTSASMQAVDVAPNRLAVAKKKVQEIVDGLGLADRVLVAKMDASTVPLSTMTSEPTELTEAVGRLASTDTRADLGRGLAFAVDVLRDAKRPEIRIVSDGNLDPEAAKGLPLDRVPIRFIPVGKRGKNVAVTAFSVRRYPLDVSRYEVLLEVTNTNDAPVDVELTLLGDGNVVDVSRLSLKANERLPRVYADLGGASRMLEARIRLADGSSDDLPADDRAYALMPERRRARVQVVTRGNTYLDAALLLDEYLDVTSTAPGAYRPEASFDVTIFDGVAPAIAPKAGGALYLAPAAENSPVKVGKAISDFGFDTWDRKSPLLRYMAVDNVQVARGHTFVPEKGDRVVGASELGPILVAGTREGRPFVALGFDPRDSDLVLRIAWPLFVLNVIHSFVEDDSSYVSAYRTGAPWRVPAPSDASLAWVRYPSGERHEVPVKEGRAVLFGEHAGFYELSAGSPTATPQLFAANLSDDAESHVAPNPSLTLPGAKAGPDEGFHAGVRRELWVYFVMAAVALSALEWLSYHRRVTV